MIKCFRNAVLVLPSLSLGTITSDTSNVDHAHAICAYDRPRPTESTCTVADRPRPMVITLGNVHPRHHQYGISQSQQHIRAWVEDLVNTIIFGEPVVMKFVIIWKTIIDLDTGIYIMLP